MNKIVFINSAHIRYGEVALDGNVHFTGTQGVGKTTLLRALLFFYNADKDKLGLRKQNQHTFDDYYVPTPASYIIYEVVRGVGERPFSVILFRHHNRAAYRFVDAPYDKEWFVDSHGVVASDPLTVRQRIQSQGIDLSGIVERYTQYLDIIYGNRSTRVSKDMLKYYLLRSQQYDNIRRIIQNVFLNERVDAGFIKNTIISSLSGEEEELAIDLNFFRSKLVNFTDELKDISLWTAKNRHGVEETRRDADMIIKTAHGITAAEHSMRQHCGMLNYARYKVERDIPLLNDKISRKRDAVKDIEGKISGLKSRFDDEHEKKIKAIGVLADKLKEAADLRKKYNRMGIEGMIARVDNLPALRLELQQKENLLSKVLTQYNSISEKYKMLKDRLLIDKQKYVQSREEQCNNIYHDFNEREDECRKRLTKQEKEIQELFKGQIDRIERNIESNREILHEQEILRLKAANSSPMGEEIEACSNTIRSLEKEVTALERQKLENDNRMDILKNQFENECQRLEADFSIHEIKIQSKISQLKAKCDKERGLLEKFKGSFCEWLDRNVDSWELSIGKVVDEKEILYSQNLKPTIAGGDARSFFGVNIDLDAISREVRTPSMIEERIEQLRSEIDSLSEEINRLRQEKDSLIGEKGKKSKAVWKSIENENNQILHKIEVCRQHIKTESLRLEDIKVEEVEILKRIDEGYAEKIEELKLSGVALYETLQTTKGKYDRELRKVRKTCEEERQKDRNHRDSLLNSIKEDVAKYERWYTDKVSQLESEEYSAFSTAGADVRMLDGLKNEIEHAKTNIERIERERENVAVYRGDCERLLDHEGEFQTEKRSLEEKDLKLRQKYDAQRVKLELKKVEESRLLSDLQTKLDKATEAMQKTDEFIASAACPPDLKEMGAISTELECLVIIDTIKTLQGQIYRLSDSLKSQINDFHRRFSPGNTFKFPLEFDSTSGYLRYADSLEDFISNDKIKDFQQVTSNLYRDILSRAASDFNMLLGREAEIRRIVSDINFDFSRKTFAGVIRSILLRLDRSTMPIILQLQNITDFWNANQYELGELNLFSEETRDDVNHEAIKYLKSLTEVLTRTPDLKRLPLEEIFSLKFRIEENDNTTDWTENLKAVGSEGTDILVKAIMNILLVSVFKKRAGQAVDFRLHCMMDEIGRLADENIQGILSFANERGIFIVNSSPKAHRPLSYRHLYMLSKGSDANTIVQPILTTRQAELL